ncbi:methionine aminotransferase [Flavilitoribacter nigricans]|uniref:Methionine aminotransferase n=1 Tax=Flavilitoribacter nigricans (strain ATCC 23147 / DSM 23189 / NBRC 102662 / NCIMB 1420 / SS-2) TaxID=1122177 RepID=A0A2D0N6Y1_FLAN2|nr:methionine aminotransferase [Flavilitoribacter nigricans]PHN03889.1 methionine aminotransferase [Flavilitoribacter nigricans DSM 23189 = NBRC 102662]
MQITSKLPNVGTTIFTVMSAMANEYGAINLSQGFPNFPTSERLNDLVTEHLRVGHNQYAPMMGVRELQEQIAHKIKLMYGVEVDPIQEVTITSGATEGLFTSIAALVHRGEEVIILEPAYDSYRPAIEVVGGVPVIYQLFAPDFKIDWDAVQALITERTRMIVINTPTNPTGAAFSPEDMQALERITADTNILVLSDEVYEHLIYDGLEHQSVLRYPKLRERSLAVYSFGKTFHKTGWRIGYCVAPPELTAEFRKVHQFNTFSINTPIQYALADFLKDPREYLELPDFFQKKRDFFLQQLEGSRLKPLTCSGTYFHLFDYSEISDMPEREFAAWMTREIGVAAIPVSAFYSNGHNNGVIRLCFAKTESTLKAATERLQSM